MHSSGLCRNYQLKLRPERFQSWGPKQILNIHLQDMQWGLTKVRNPVANA